MAGVMAEPHIWRENGVIGTYEEYSIHLRSRGVRRDVMRETRNIARGAKYQCAGKYAIIARVRHHHE